MKFLLLSALLLGSSTAAFADDAVLLNMTCKLTYLNESDPKNIDIHDVYTGDVALKEEDRVKFASNNGHDYYLSISDLTFGNAEPRQEIGIAIRDSKTTDLIYTSSSIYSLEVPELLTEDGPNMIVDCKLKK